MDAIALLSLCATLIGGCGSDPVLTEIGKTPPGIVSHYRATQRPDDIPAKQLYIWQGFKHEWRRMGGEVPHRISLFASYIAKNIGSKKGTPEEFTMAQSTGVDANYMWPEGYYARVDSPGITVQNGHLDLGWTDELNHATPQIAVSQLRAWIRFPIPPGENTVTPVALLNGIDLNLKCDPAKQPKLNPCNSNGMWPYVFNIAIGECEKDPLAKDAGRCPLYVDIDRSWTPNHGGYRIAGYDVVSKPLNEKLDFSLKVYYTLVSGPPSAFAASRPSSIHFTDILTNRKPQGIRLPFEPEAGMSRGTFGIAGFGFMLMRPEKIDATWKISSPDMDIRGRYIAGMHFAITPSATSKSGVPAFNVTENLWSANVVNSDVVTTMLVRKLSFDNHATLQSRSVHGLLCSSSSPEAPWFSTWKKCTSQSEENRSVYGGKVRQSYTVDVEKSSSEIKVPKVDRPL